MAQTKLALKGKNESLIGFLMTDLVKFKCFEVKRNQLGRVAMTLVVFLKST